MTKYFSFFTQAWNELPPLASGLRESLRAGYGKKQLITDTLAGITVGIVALPLAMALAIASGVPPQYGLYTAIVGGMIIAILGGSRVSVSGPTAAFVVILFPISTQYGIGGLVVATGMAGLILLVMGLARMGSLINFIPHPVTTGFTAGIGVVLAILQIKDFFGLTFNTTLHNFPERIGAIIAAFPTSHVPDLMIGIITLVILIVWPRINFKVRIPAHLIALLAGTLVALISGIIIQDFHIATIGTRFSFEVNGQVLPGIPNVPPLPLLPWHLPGPDGQPLALSFDLIRALLGPAFAIALLGAIESLLCAVMADSMTGTRHNPNSELIGQGIGNIIVPFFGGIAATGALARTVTNIRAGGHSPVASVIHAIFLLIVVMALAPLLAYLPMASLAALLLIVAWNMCDFPHFLRIMRVAPLQDTAVLLTCFTLTIIFDMEIAVGVGVVLAALLFIKRMADFGNVRALRHSEHHALDSPLSDRVLSFIVEGPLFFGVAEKTAHTLTSIHSQTRAVIFDLGNAPIIDFTGLVALESTIKNLNKRGIYVLLADLQPQLANSLKNAGITPEPDKLAIFSNFETALRHTKDWLIEKDL